MSQQLPKYKIYATALDAFQYYLDSESDTAYQEFIDRLNRKPFTSEAAEKGTAFNNLVDELLKSGTIADTDFVQYGDFTFRSDIVNHFVGCLQGSVSQYFCKGLLETSKGLVELYGYIDEIQADTTIDIKTTGNYTFPKYLHNFQQVVYPFCLQQEGIDITRFKYMITDFNNLFEEDYMYTGGADLQRMTNQLELLIDFLEMNRHKITDKKIFGGYNVFTAQYDNQVNATIIQ